MKSAALAWRGMLEGTINPAKGESMTDQETPERAHVTADDIEAANDLIDFIEACPSMFHTAATIMAELDEAGFTYLPENAAWDIEPGGRYYTQRNTSSVVAFKVGEDLAATWGEGGVAGDYHFQLTASHSDSPTFKVKAVPELDGAGETLRLNTEAYGGMIDYTWFDRPLALAGRVLVREGDRIESRLLATEREVAIIPSLAIHMNRGVNESFAPNRAVDLCPLISAGDLKQGDFDALIADELDVEPEQILGRDLFLVNRQDARIWGWADEFISTPKLDDLACAERNHLDRQRELANGVNDLGFVHDPHDLVGVGGHDLLPQQGSAAALDAVEVLVDFVGAVNGHVDVINIIDVDDFDAVAFGLLLGAARSGHAGELQAFLLYAAAELVD